MAKEEPKEEVVEAPSKNGAMKIMIIINAVVLLLLIAGGVAFFLMNGDKKHDEAPAGDEHAVEGEGGDGDGDKKAGKQPIYIPLTPAFVVNLDSQDETSFLQVEMDVMTYDMAVDEALKKNESRVRGELLLLLSSKQYQDINNIEGKRKLSQEAIAVIQQVVDDSGAKGKVEALYFTSFVMQ